MRVGHHCARPIARRLGFPAMTRATFDVDNTVAEGDTLAEGVRVAHAYFG
ncbi:aminotransferase class V-fold PLP-dependent enzyme [Kitasatospora sp. NPDC059571]